MQFGRLPSDVVERIVDKFVLEVAGQLREKKVEIDLRPAARTWLAEHGYDEQFGARPLSRLIQTEVKDRLADEMLFGSLLKGGRVTVDVGDEGLRFDFVGPAST